MRTLILNIAGEFHDVLFDGEKVTEPLFPDQKIQRIVARCGIVLTQSDLVDICRRIACRVSATG